MLVISVFIKTLIFMSLWLPEQGSTIDPKESKMSYFMPAVEKVLLHEGGYVNHPLDRGGETNWGITRRTYESYFGRTAGANEIKDMTRDVAIQIYKDMYWNEVKADDIKNYGVAFAIFDQAVNRGPYNAIRQAQRALGVFPDGRADETFINRLNNTPSYVFMNNFLKESEMAYRQIVASNPSQQVFLAGWLKRVDSIKKYVEPFMERELTAIAIQTPINQTARTPTSTQASPSLDLSLPAFSPLQITLMGLALGLAGLVLVARTRRA
jgi:lysozyme family protein